MGLSIKNREAACLARALARRTGESITETVLVAVRERLKREEGRRTVPRLKKQFLEIGARCVALPDLDQPSADEITGFDEAGLPR